MLAGVGADERVEVAVDVLRGVPGPSGDGRGDGAARGRGVGGVVDVEVELEPVARREHDDARDGGGRGDELAADCVHVGLQTLQHGQVEVVVARDEGQEHHGYRLNHPEKCPAQSSGESFTTPSAP